ncbi:unnamed protein product [Caenorhabditis brenneri]
MPELMKNDDKSIRSYILNDVLEKVPIDKSYENLCKVIGNDAIAFYDFQYWYYRFLGGDQDLDFDRSSEPEPLQFSDLPVDAVKLIVDKLMLKRVSKPLRDLVLNRGVDCTYIAVSSGHNLINVSYGSGRIVYAMNKESLDLYKHLSFIREAKIVYGGDHYEYEALNDLKLILKNPKLEISHFEVSLVVAPAAKFFNKLQILFKSLHHQLSVRSLSVRPDHPDNILNILPYLKPGQLKEITINNRRGSNDWRGLESKIHKIIQLEQWKQAKELVLLDAWHLFPAEVLLQFEKYWIKTWTLGQFDLAGFAMKFAASPVFEYCRFDIKEPSHEWNFMGFIGFPAPITPKYRSVRHYLVPNTDKLLVFKQFTFGDIEIEKKTRDDVQ